jgi:hypothetical protein
MSKLSEIIIRRGDCHICGDEDTELIQIQHDDGVVCSSDGACRNCLFTMFCSNENKCPFDREPYGEWVRTVLLFNNVECPEEKKSGNVVNGYANGIFIGEEWNDDVNYIIDEQGVIRFPEQEVEYKNDFIRLREISDELTNNRNQEQVSRSEEEKMSLIEHRQILVGEAHEIREREIIRRRFRDNFVRLYNEQLQQMIEEERELDERERDLIDSIEQLDILERERRQSGASYTRISRRRARLMGLLEELRQARQ